MARQEIILGTSPTGLGGDPPRTASQKINFMTKELYASVESMGTAATRNVQVNALDNSAGKLLGPGAFGLGGGSAHASDLFALPGSGFYYSNPSGGTQNPLINSAGSVLHVQGARDPPINLPRCGGKSKLSRHSSLSAETARYIVFCGRFRPYPSAFFEPSTGLTERTA